jgi:DNA polymerase III delta prime subunit
VGRLKTIYDSLAPNHLDSGDRNTVHSYIPLYESLFAPLRGEPMQLLELGVFVGHGVMMWHEYFERGIIYGVDIVDRFAFDKPEDGRLRLSLNTDMTREDEMAGVCDNGPFDIVIEDGSHKLRDQVKTLEVVWPSVRPGGYYIIEDVAEADALRHILRSHPGFLGLIDFRQVKGRYDDVLAVLYKEKV